MKNKLVHIFLRTVKPVLFKEGLSPQVYRQRLESMSRLLRPFSSRRKITTGIESVPCMFLHPYEEKAGFQLLYLHGGAYGMGSAHTHKKLVGELSKRLQAEAFIPEYRLAPEHPFPAALEDAVAVYRHLAAQGPVIVAGDSAGGGLTFALTSYCIENRLTVPHKLVCLSPWLDLAVMQGQDEHAAEDPMITAADLRFWAANYAGTDLQNPLVSPYYTSDEILSGFPPTLIQAGTAEILHEEIRRTVTRMQALGVHATFSEYPGMIHVFQVLKGFLRQSGEAVAEIVDFCKDV